MAPITCAPIYELPCNISTMTLTNMPDLRKSLLGLVKFKLEGSSRSRPPPKKKKIYDIFISNKFHDPLPPGRKRAIYYSKIANYNIKIQDFHAQVFKFQSLK